MRLFNKQLLISAQVTPGHLEASDAVQIAFLLLVAGNATMVNMINLVRLLFKRGNNAMAYHMPRVLSRSSSIPRS